MTGGIPSRAPNFGTATILKIVLLYAAFAALWILLSDKVVEWSFHEPAQVTLVNTLKGWVFVAVTSLLLYGLMLRLTCRADAEPAPVPGAGLKPEIFLALTALTIIILMAVSLIHTFKQERAKEAARLQAIADLKAGQISDWLRERDRDGHFVQSSRFFAETYYKWRYGGDPASGEVLKKRLNEYREDRFFQGVLILDEWKQVLWDSEDGGPDVGHVLQDAASRATAEGRALHAGPYLDGKGQPRLDLLAPLLLVNAPRKPVVVLRVDLSAYLLPTLQTWPAPGSSGETLLFQRDGNEVLFINGHRHRDGAPPLPRAPLEGENPPAARVLLGKAEQGSPVEGVDHRGVPVMGVVRAVPGTDWFLMAKMDLAEVQAEAGRDALWISLTGVLALFMAMAGFFLSRKNRELAFSQRERDVQAEKLRALLLLESIAESSGDPIFAKDKEGRYMLFNREAVRVSGKSRDEVLGRDDFALFPPDQAASVIANDRKVMEENRAVTFQEELTTADGETTYLVTKGPLHDATGDVIGMFGISHDISERKLAEKALREAKEMLEQRVEERTAELMVTNERLTRQIRELERAEAALQESEDKYRSIFAAAKDAIIVFDCETGKVLDANAFACDLYGYAREEMLELSGTDLSAEPGETVRGLETRSSWIPLHYHRKKDGSVFPVEISVSYLTQKGVRISTSVIRDITERREAEEALRASEAQLRYLSSRLMVSVEEEKKRIAGELHDSIGSTLCAVRFALESSLQRAKGQEDTGLSGALEELIPLVQHCTEETRRIYMDLRPSVLDDLGIVATIAWFCRKFESIYSGIRVDKRIGVLEDDVPSALKIVVFRILQEALNNAAKHSSATLIDLSLQNPDGGAIELVIEDNGIGFSLDEPGEGLGLTSMQERVESSGGVFSIKSARGKGTRIRASWKPTEVPVEEGRGGR